MSEGSYDKAAMTLSHFMERNSIGACEFDHAVLIASTHVWISHTREQRFLNISGEEYEQYTVGEEDPFLGTSLKIPVLTEEDYLWVMGEVDDEEEIRQHGYDLPKHERRVTHLACYQQLREQMWEELARCFRGLA